MYICKESNAQLLVHKAMLVLLALHEIKAWHDVSGLSSLCEGFYCVGRQ